MPFLNSLPCTARYRRGAGRGAPEAEGVSGSEARSGGRPPTSSPDMSTTSKKQPNTANGVMLHEQSLGVECAIVSKPLQFQAFLQFSAFDAPCCGRRKSDVNTYQQPRHVLVCHPLKGAQCLSGGFLMECKCEHIPYSFGMIWACLRCGMIVSSREAWAILEERALANDKNKSDDGGGSICSSSGT